MFTGLRIKEIRKRRKMTLKSLGEKCNLSSSFLCDVEKCRTNPSVEVLVRISNVLHTPISYLVGEDDISEIVPSNLLQITLQLSSTKEGSKALEYLSDFNDWNECDILELLKYLDIKNQLRNK